MGLDVTAHKRLRRIGAYPVTDADWNAIDDDDYVAVSPNANFPDRADGLEPGVYAVEGARRLHAGSYGGYNRWREQLAALVGTTPQAVWEAKDPSGPFVELINFSDCEGVIGPKTSAKLAADFEGWRERAQVYAASLSDYDSEWWLGKYREWQAVFRFAADTGAVDFH